MIARIWHGRTTALNADTYFDFLKARAVPDYKSVAGNCGVHLMRRFEGDVAHFITLTFWESRGAVASFAGADIERAKYYPEDKDFLLEFEPNVQHYEVFSAQ
jgi:heme-degrading monooxygenase HmoA